jgi:hypothetical protein
MLHGMQTTAQTQPSPSATSFAGLLAALAAPPKPKPEDEALPWNTAELGEDISKLSYERALRAHARYKPSSQLGDLPQPEKTAVEEAMAAASLNTEPTEKPAEPAIAAPPAMLDRDLRRASVTIRLSQTECDQLHHRAAEAGLTVSAYLRSCTFEADLLRAQVKEAVAQMRQATAQVKPAAPAAIRRTWFGWLRRLWPWRLQHDHITARA